jgi:hypothetical protein
MQKIFPFVFKKGKYPDLFFVQNYTKSKVRSNSVFQLSLPLKEEYFAKDFNHPLKLHR